MFGKNMVRIVNGFERTIQYIHTKRERHKPLVHLAYVLGLGFALS